jgi:hypothetical protein
MVKYLERARALPSTKRLSLSGEGPNVLTCDPKSGQAIAEDFIGAPRDNRDLWHSMALEPT